MTRSPAVWLALCACLTASPGSRLAGQIACEPCHGELELLRQHVATLDEARALLVSEGEVGASAHAETDCSTCHIGYLRFPHAADTGTETCGACHSEVEARWRGGVHAEDDHADCVSCHGVHDVQEAELRASPARLFEARAVCEACHDEQRIPVDDPHADSVACSDCHDSHETSSPASEGALANVLSQSETCGACHAAATAEWEGDAHQVAVRLLAEPGAGALEGATGSDPPACTACHGAHRLRTSGGVAADDGVSGRCAGCHEDFASSFADSYHGQADALGSEAVATCYDCHGGHGIYPAADERSAVSEGHLLETCRSCHSAATDGFVGFQPHANHHDREKYPHVYWSYRLMTGLLIGVFSFFGGHSVLWLVRSAIDRTSLAEEGVTNDG